MVELWVLLKTSIRNQAPKLNSSCWKLNWKKHFSERRRCLLKISPLSSPSCLGNVDIQPSCWYRELEIVNLEKFNLQHRLPEFAIVLVLSDSQTWSPMFSLLSNSAAIIASVAASSHHSLPGGNQRDLSGDTRGDPLQSPSHHLL